MMDHNHYMNRVAVESYEGWREKAFEMPYLQFPSDWEISIIPPFGGAVIRFLVRKGKASVSIYADYFAALGAWNTPHWEIYPNAEGDNERFVIEDTQELLGGIQKSLEAQLSEETQNL